MNKENFEQELKRQICSSAVDTSFLDKWFTKTLARLHTSFDQTSGISHPRHRGDARETHLLQILREIFPNSLNIEKGFVTDSLASHSREQDLVVTDQNTSGNLIKAGEISYFPVESALASIEVKSKLNLSEIRKCIVNCVSVKKLLYGLNGGDKNLGTRYCYAIFAYSCSSKLQNVCNQLNKVLEDVPVLYRPNVVYILGAGFLMPAHDAGFEITHNQMFFEGQFQSIEGLGTNFIEKSEANLFLWFLTAVIDHCLEERKSRVDPSYLSYVMKPVIFQTEFERSLRENEPARYAEIIDKQNAAKKP